MSPDPELERWFATEVLPHERDEETQQSGKASVHRMKEYELGVVSKNLCPRRRWPRRQSRGAAPRTRDCHADESCSRFGPHP